MYHIIANVIVLFFVFFSDTTMMTRGRRFYLERECFRNRLPDRKRASDSEIVRVNVITEELRTI